MNRHGMVEYFKMPEPALRLALDFLNTLFKNCKRGIGLLLVNHERRRKPKRIFARA